MFRKKNDKEVDIGKLNDVIHVSHGILKVLFFVIIILGIYAAIILIKEVKILPFLFTVLRILSPLFIGIFLAWLFDPIVTKLHKKGWKRGLGATVCYLVFVGLIALVIGSLIPMLSEQINELVSNTIPAVFKTCEGWINGAFDKLNTIESFDAMATKADIFLRLEGFVSNLTSSLPEMIINFTKAVFSGLGTLGVGLIIGFFLLLDFDKHKETLYNMIPRKYRNDGKKLLQAINRPLKRFVNGALLDCTFMFIVMAIGFSIIGLKGAALFALFCAITNVIPYIGPYIGGAPAVLVGLTQSTTVGIAVLIFIVIVQTLEGNLLQPLIMSKTTKLSPIAIILGLLVFGHFFGILGMVLSTPILGAIKELIMFFDEKYDFLEFARTEEKIKVK